MLITRYSRYPLVGLHVHGSPGDPSTSKEGQTDPREPGSSGDGKSARAGFELTDVVMVPDDVYRTSVDRRSRANVGVPGHVIFES